MLTLLLGVAITSFSQEPQGQPPVFRAEAYVVALPVTVSRRTWFGGSKPVTNLDAADLEIILENDVYVPIRLDPDPKTPGRSLLSFTPPVHLRDGKPRQVQLRIKKRNTINTTMTLPPFVPGAT